MVAVPLWDHLRELRRRLAWVLGIFVVSCGLAYRHTTLLLTFLVQPLHYALLCQRKNFQGVFAEGIQNRACMIYTHLTEGFLTHLRVALAVGLAVTAPFFLWHAWRFVQPALDKRQKYVCAVALGMAPFLFGVGVLLAYVWICPLAWKFFLSFQNSDDSLGLSLVPKISEYVSLTLRTMVGFGVGFQLPVLMVVLVSIGWLSLPALQRARKYAFLAITVVAALLTPPDIISPLCLIVPVYGLYELALVWLCWMGRRHTRTLLDK